MQQDKKGQAWWATATKEEKMTVVGSLINERKSNSEICRILELSSIGMVANIRNQINLKKRAEDTTPSYLSGKPRHNGHTSNHDSTHHQLEGSSLLPIPYREPEEQDEDAQIEKLTQLITRSWIPRGRFRPLMQLSRNRRTYMRKKAQRFLQWSEPI